MNAAGSTPETAPSDARGVRHEDAFDVERASAWLSALLPGLTGLPRVTQYRGGASNLTYRLDYPDATGGIASYVLRRPPAGAKAASAHDMRREFEMQKLLRGPFGRVPQVIGLCTDADVIGSDFYVMEHVPGLILRADLPASLTLTEDHARTLGALLWDTLADLHAVSPDESGLSRFYRGPGYVERQVSGWSSRYRAARTDDVPDAEDVMRWLEVSRPPDSAARIIHGDWRFDNVVLDPQDLTFRAVLDWEMATVGDPLMDLGSALAYWVEAGDDEVFALFRRQPSHVPGMPTRAEIVERYLGRTGLQVEDWRFYEVFGLFRLAVIVQQIWFRYRAGQTTNPAFAGFGAACTYLISRCRGLLPN